MPSSWTMMASTYKRTDSSNSSYDIGIWEGWVPRNLLEAKDRVLNDYSSSLWSPTTATAWRHIILAFHMDNDCTWCQCQATRLPWLAWWRSVGYIQTEFAWSLFGLADGWSIRIDDVSHNLMILDMFVFNSKIVPGMTSKGTSDRNETGWRVAPLTRHTPLYYSWSQRPNKPSQPVVDSYGNNHKIIDFWKSPKIIVMIFGLMTFGQNGLQWYLA